MKFTITRKHIRAALHFAAKKDIRYYLNAICITQNQRGTVVEATNGHVLGIIRTDSTPQAENRVIISREDCEKLKGTKKQGDEELHFTIEGARVACEIPSQGLIMHFAVVDAKFPDTDRVVPQFDGGEQVAATYNPEYLLAFAHAAEELRGSKQLPVIYQRGDNAALVSIGLDDFVGVVMPVRKHHSEFQPSLWIYQPKTDQKLAA
jgi:DNA polymerase-3 subunit beta